jgi:type IV secretory pathway TrbD component
MTEPAAAPDPLALRRRVLQTGLVTMALFLVLAFAIAGSGLSDWWLLVAMAAVHRLVVRPMMRPVRDASKLRRSLAYQAFLDRKDERP